MPLEFDANRAVYDEDRDLVVFMAMSGPRLVRCSVTREALLTLARRRAESAKEMLDAYRSHAERIHQIADRKYMQQQVDTDGTVLVIRRDVQRD